MNIKKDFLLILSSSFLIIIFFTLFNFHNGSFDKVEDAEVGSCATDNLSGEFLPEERLAFFEEKEIEVPLIAEAKKEANVLGTTNDQKYIEVDLSEQKLKAWDGDKLFLETPVSTGLQKTPTPQGEFRIWIKLKAAKMEGGRGSGYYYLPNVPYVMYFGNDKVPNWKGYGLHGTYWHNDFGRPRSHGCVNLPTPIAQKLFYWTTPILPEGKSAVRSTDDNPGTRIVIHE